jgi:alkylation response protein AidB-like acyl-CoA dehydrogenase
MMFDLHLTEEQIKIRDMVREFAKNEIAPTANARDQKENFDERFPWEVMEKASKLGLRTFGLSEQHGGMGVDALTACIIIEELAVGDVGVSATLGQTSALAHAWFDVAFSKAQREKYLPEFLADHHYHLSTAGHEPDTDLGFCYHRPPAANAGYKTTAIRDSNGDWIINGVKNFITSAPIAKLLVVHVRAKMNKDDPGKPATFIVRGGHPGLTIREHDKVGRRLGSNGELSFVDCRVKADDLLGEVGKSPFAATAMGRRNPRFQAMNLGIGRAAYEAALDYAKMRKQGGHVLVEHQAIGLTLASMAIKLEAARALIWQSAWASENRDAYNDGSLPDLPLQSIAKVYTSEAVQQVVLDAAQMFGGMGVMREMPAQKYVRDALIFLHSEHSNDVARLKIAEDLVGFQRVKGGTSIGE